MKYSIGMQISHEHKTNHSNLHPLIGKMQSLTFTNYVQTNSSSVIEWLYL